ncbi:TolB family protein [Adhaeretor mobilis]|uniref:Translocation protein TolB n=1 Tax=Adhaeretor mobilis TaxID=1930276 RepID=A0A517N2G6_9BACT|nr:PD40 domain-containing protein [Adhaeretor mobilis]QDT01327.1 translocation protein TolB [Adhaeretor mobilis]
MGLTRRLVRSSIGPLGMLPNIACVCVWLSLLLSAPPLQAQQTQDVIEGEPEEHNSQVFIAEPDGSQMRLLGNVPDHRFQGSSEWSRDGKRIVFDTSRGGDESGVKFGKIGIVNADGSEPRILGAGVMPSLAPGGNRLAYTQSGKGVLLMDFSGDKVTTESLDNQGWGTAWSPDGESVAYGLSENLVIYDTVSEEKRMLLDDPSSPYQYINWNFAWSADSKKIAFQARLDDTTVLAIVDARGAKQGHKIRYIGAFAPALCWSPDGEQILFSAVCPQRDGRSQIYSINPNDWSPPSLLPQQPTNRSLKDPSFSPDGKKLTFSAGLPVK